MIFQVTNRVLCVTRVCGRGQVLLSRSELSACSSSTSQTSEVCNIFFSARGACFVTSFNRPT